MIGVTPKALLEFDSLAPDLRDTIRRRDAALQGSVNPMVADHGSSSEARQYAGRKVEADWAPPFETSAS